MLCGWERSLERLCERKAIAFGIEHSELAEPPWIAHRLPLNVRAFRHELRVQRIRIGHVEGARSNARVPIRAPDEQNAHAVAIHDSEGVLLVVDVGASH